MLNRHSGFKSSEGANSWVCGQNKTVLHNFNRSPVLCTSSALGADHSPQLFFLWTTELAIRMPSNNTFNTQLYTIAVKLTPTPGAQTACCTVAQAHRLPLQPQCHLPREAVSLTIWLWHLCAGNPLCRRLLGSSPGWRPLRWSWLTWGSLSLSSLRLRRWHSCLGWQF